MGHFFFDNKKIYIRLSYDLWTIVIPVWKLGFRKIGFSLGLDGVRMCVIQSGHCGGWSWKYLEHQAGQVKVGGFELFCERKMAMEKPSNYIPSGQNRWFADTKWLVLKGPKFNQYVGTLLLAVLFNYCNSCLQLTGAASIWTIAKMVCMDHWRCSDVVMFFVGSDFFGPYCHTSCGEVRFFSCV